MINSQLDNLKLNKKINLKGHVSKIRKLGKELLFLDLLITGEVVQLIIPSKIFDSKITIQSYIKVLGTVKKRKSINESQKFGELEVLVEKLSLISVSERPPIIVKDEIESLEKTRMQYRYLDLRRKPNQNMLKFRSDLNFKIRDYFISKNFLEIETPILSTPTHGGANEILIELKNHKNKFYSLSQSPQIYKQLLIYSGVERYFQIAKCFRDEDSRSDRQLEFTQLDIEWNNTNRDDLFELIQGMIEKIFLDVLNEKIDKNFPLLSYLSCVKKFGTDKPDLRYKDLELVELTSLKFDKVIMDSLKLNKSEIILGIPVPKNKNIKSIYKKQNLNKSFFVEIENQKIVNTSYKIFQNKDFLNKNNYSYIFLRGENKLDFYLEVGKIRNEIISKYEFEFSKSSKKYEFAWVVDWPLFELTKENEISSSHNPFSLPENEKEFLNLFKYKKIDEEKLLKVKSKSYDLVLNGFEIGGGSERISDLNLQKKVFEFLNVDKKEINEKFAWFFDSMKFGTPKHMGIAIGIDRLVSTLLNLDSIRDSIAFPKTTHGTDELTKGPIYLDLKK